MHGQCDGQAQGRSQQPLRGSAHIYFSVKWTQPAWQEQGEGSLEKAALPHTERPAQAGHWAPRAELGHAVPTGSERGAGRYAGRAGL